jgi:oxygen-independent coproporphyrinogen-3 oxidase
MPLSEPLPLGLYIHIPWCVRKCPYCDFNSHTQRDELPEAAYIDALLRDLETELPGVWGRRISSIFIGGGTPSLFSAAAIARLLSGIRALIPVTATAEITLEANPGTAEAERFSGYREAGVNRLSIGVQSFQDRYLQALGRIHDGRQAERAVALARTAGFDRINLDLMFGLPGQTPQDAARDLDTALDLNPGHLSYYQLTLEPNTPFHRAPPSLPLDDRIDDIHQQGIEGLHKAGYRRYEISAFSQPGQECRHNLNYWQFGDYLGIGAGAHAKVSGPAGIVRRWRHRHPKQYMDQPTMAGERHLDEQDLRLEFMMNALRLIDGVPATLFWERTGQAPESLEHELAVARERGLLDPDAEVLRPTELGICWLNELLVTFITD